MTVAPLFDEPRSSLTIDGRMTALRCLIDSDWRRDCWDDQRLVLRYRRDDPYLGGRYCCAPGCDAQTQDKKRGLCKTHRSAWQRCGLPLDEWVNGLPPVDREAARLCAVQRDTRQCERPSITANRLCNAHQQQWLRAKHRGESLAEFLMWASPHRSLGICMVASCSLHVHLSGLCPGHHSAWLRAGKPTKQHLDAWLLTAAPITNTLEINLIGLRPLAAMEVRYALQRRDRSGAKTDPSFLVTWINLLRTSQAESILDTSSTDLAALNAVTRSVAAVAGDCVSLAYSSPDAERRKLRWDARVFGHTSATVWDFSGITQSWLRAAVQDWAFIAQTRITAASVRSYVNGMRVLSESLALRDDGGHDRSAVGRADIERFATHLAALQRQDTITACSRNQRLRTVRHVLSEARGQGLLAGVDDRFSITRELLPRKIEIEEEPGRALPESVIDQLLHAENLALLAEVVSDRGVLGEHAPTQLRLMIETLIETGRRPREVTHLALDTAGRDNQGHPILFYDNTKSGRLRRQLPIGEDLHARLLRQAQWVRQQFPDTAPTMLVMFPRPTKNAGGTAPIRVASFWYWVRQWIEQLPTLIGLNRGADGAPAPFPRGDITLYSFRHSFAQRHADAGTPVDVLQKLMDHDDIKTTQGYYRVTATRKRLAAERVAQMRRDSSGKRAPAATDTSGRLREERGEVAVPFGLCLEPSNVKAGGQACPIRYRCIGCAEFRSDPSHLPDLIAHVDELVRARQRGLAMQAPDWSLVPKQEIAKLRSLIHTLQQDLDALPEDERATVETACQDLRTIRRSVPAHFLRKPTMP
ncbi:tyrosine-type recombinase/integrase [Mycobacterium sp.]|uniref:tyrosine-type recombinase/integrase n=1 Tax=Mycobacterium sp. TaxID=1785 RepID=UPI003BAB9E6F